MATAQRDNLFDYAKCFLILFVVFDHLGIKFPISGAWIMVGFFFFSGYWYKTGRPIGAFIRSRFKRLIIPFWITLAAGSLFELFRANYFGYCDSTIALAPLINGIWGSNFMPGSILQITLDFITPVTYRETIEGVIELGTPSTSALWFLPAMFTGSIMFAVYQEKIRRDAWNDIPAITAFLFLAWTETFWGGIQYPWGIGRGFFACACMIVGFNCNAWGIFKRKKEFAYIALTGLIVAIALNRAGLIKAAMISSYYGNFSFGGVLTLFFGSFGAVFFFMLVISLLQNVIPNSSVLLQFGKNSMSVYRWHIFSITLFGVAFHELLGMPIVSDVYFMALIPSTDIGLKIIAGLGSMVLCTLFGMLTQWIGNKFIKNAKA